jgi:hypothetical protein
LSLILFKSIGKSLKNIMPIARLLAKTVPGVPFYELKDSARPFGGRALQRRQTTSARIRVSAGRLNAPSFGTTYVTIIRSNAARVKAAMWVV